MHYVYLLRSESEPLQRYIGLTDDVQARLASHNSGANPHMPAQRHYFPVPNILNTADASRRQNAGRHGTHPCTAKAGVDQPVTFDPAMGSSSRG